MLLPAPYDIFIQRGIAYGPLVITVYDDLPPLTNVPGTPIVTPHGTTGGTTWTYKIVARKTNGRFSAASPAGTTATGNALLVGGNYNRLTWVGTTDADSYDIYRTVAGGTPATTGLIGNTTTLTFADNGFPGDGNAAPATGGPGVIVDLTGYIAHAHARRDPPDTVLQNLSPTITNFAGGEITIGKFTDEQTLNFKLVNRGKWSLVLENSSGDWLPAIIAGAYTVVDSVTRNSPVPIPPPPVPFLDVIAYTNVTNIFTTYQTFTGVRFATKIVSADYLLTSLDFELLVDATAGDVTIQLPPSTASGQLFHIKRIDASINNVTILPDGADLIDDSISVSLTNQWSDSLVMDAAVGLWDQFG